MNLTFSGILALVVLAGPLAMAQEPMSGDEVGGPAADAPAAAPVELTDEERADEIDDLEPGVPSEVLVSDVRRSETTGVVMDELDLGRTEITGNQELPTVLYIVPWKKSDPGDLMGRPANTLLDEILAPVDRGEFVRQVDYYDDLFESKVEQ
jgi:hypothetical protein